MMRVMIVGANGQLGSDLVKAFGDGDVIPTGRRDMDVCKRRDVEAWLDRHRPDLVVNTAAFHKLADCQASPDVAFAVNALGALNLALACKEVGCCALVYLSTDYVFSGNKRTPYIESDNPGPVNVYGWSKLVGEFLVRHTLAQSIVIRTSALFGVAGSSGKGGNFVETMLRLAREDKPIRVVVDQVTSPTYTTDLARQIKVLAETTHYGIIHASGHGDCSWYEFAGEIFRQSGWKPDLVPVSSEEFGAAAPRPSYTALRNYRLEFYGLDVMRPWQEGLADYLEARRGETD